MSNHSCHEGCVCHEAGNPNPDFIEMKRKDQTIENLQGRINSLEARQATFEIPDPVSGGPLWLRILELLALRPEGLRVAPMAHQLTGASPVAITGQLRRMELRGFVDKKPRRAFADRSSWPRTWRITQEGQKAITATGQSGGVAAPKKDAA